MIPHLRYAHSPLAKWAYLLMLVLSPLFLHAQTDDRLKVHLNCSSCDQTYIKSEIAYVDYVRDQSLADLQIFVVRMTNGSGGRTYEINFTGFNKFGDIKHQIKYETLPNSSSDQIRKGMLKRIEAGLLIFLANTPMADEITIKVPVNSRPGKEERPTKDPWNYWVFRVYGDGSFSKETSQSRTYWEVGFRADRVTEDLRIRTNGETSQRRNKFIIDDEIIFSYRDRDYFSGSIVKSLSSHWSAGFFGFISKNTYNNTDLTLTTSPAIEYSFFPYSEVTKREITTSYRVGYRYNDYIETTIYDKDIEHLLRQTLAFTARFNQAWGRVYASLEGSTFLHDFTKRSLEFDSYVSLRVFKGLSARVSADFELINDQLNLPKRDATVEEILLRQRQLATAFDMGFGIGLSYTFGSMYNNIINTRL